MVQQRQKRSGILSLAGLLACLAGVGCGDTAVEPATEMQSGQVNQPLAAERALTIVSPTFLVNQIFPSMRGPVSTRSVKLADERELVWLTGYSVEVVGPDGEEPESIEYACHTNLAWPRTGHDPAFHRPAARVFTLTQGQTDVRLPTGFGLPLMSDELLTFNTQVLNLDKPDADLMVRHKVQLRYVRDSDLKTPMRPLAARAVFVMASLENEDLVYNVEVPEGVSEDAMCHAGEMPKGVTGVFRDKFDRRFAGHWVVLPGEHEYRTRVTDMMEVAYDTTIHFIGVHVHPYSKSLALRDLTTGETLWTSHHETLAQRPGLAFLDYYTSEEGLPVVAGHEYELVSVYDNPTDEPSDAMATMFLYSLDKEFEPEAVGAQASQAQADVRQGA
jgi:hypothetical protein